MVERLLAVQGQDPRGARLAVRARSSGLTATDVDHALTGDRSLVITWLNRGTLHLVRSEDYPWLHALTTPPRLKGTASRLAQLGVDARATSRGVKAIERALATHGPLTRKELGERLAAARVSSDGQALIHVLGAAGLRGVTVRGPMRGKQHCYALVREWLGDQPKVDRGRALAELGRRYLAGHGPATDRDLARWAGLPLRDARAALASIARELREREGGLVDLAKRPARAAGLPAPRLLGAFEPVLLGWSSRDDIVGRSGDAVVAGGMFLPFALVRGRAVATWKLLKGEVELTPFGTLAKTAERALERDARDVVRFLSSGA